MRKAALIPTLLATVIGMACGSKSAPPSSFTNPVVPTAAPVPATVQMPQCDSRFWDHVYRKDRLSVYSMCEHESGTVYFSQKNADGDLTFHVLPKTDRLMAAGNVGLDNAPFPPCGPKGCLMVEIQCQTKVTQGNAIGICDGFPTELVLAADQIPQAGDEIEFAGPYVLDTWHGWNEIHGAVIRITKRLTGTLSFKGIPRQPPLLSIREDDDR